jgi:hypothetical protein
VKEILVRQRFTSPWWAIFSVFGFSFTACGPNEVDLGNMESAPEVETDRVDSAAQPNVSSDTPREGLAETVTEIDQSSPSVNSEVQITYVVKAVRPGAELSVELLQDLSATSHRPGDTFNAAVTVPLVEDNMVVVPVNSLVRGEITAVQAPGGSGQEAIITVHFIDVMFNGEYFPISASVVEATPTGADVNAGRTLGRVIGGNTHETVVGAVVGAATGTAINLATTESAPVLQEGSILRLRLNERFVVRFPQGG